MGKFLSLSRLAVLGALLGTAFFASTSAFGQAPPPVPALPDTERRTAYSLTAQTGPFSVGFALYGDSTDYANWLTVSLCTSAVLNPCTVLTGVTDWTLSSATGPIATIPRPITDATITLTTARTGTLQITGARRARRTSQFAENRGVPARDLNQVVTDLVAQNREDWDLRSRQLRGQPGEIISALQPASTRAGGILCWDATGLIPNTCAAGSSGTANVVGPNVSVVGHIATFGNTTGTILLDGGLVGAGDFVGPAGAATDHVVTFASATGKVGKDSGLTLTPSTGTITLTNAKTLAVTGTMTLTPGADGQTYTFPTTSATLARTDAANTFTGHQTIEGVTSTGATGTGKFVFDTAPAVTGLTTNTINKVTITTPATGSTLTIADGKTLTDTSGIGASVLLGATGGGFAAYAGASCTNQFIRSLSVAAAATCASVANADLSNSSVTIGSTNVALGATAATIAGLTLTAPTINGGTHTAITGLGIRSTGSGAFDLTLANTENLTAGRTLTLTLNNAARTLNLSGNITAAADFTTNGANALTLTTIGTTNVTLPTSGSLATRDTAQTFSSSNIFSALTQFTDIKLSSGKIYPTGDSTTALQVTKADGTTRIVNFDTTNARIGVNKNAGAFDLDVAGAVNIDGTLTFGVGTITGLTIDNSPSSSNDYGIYWKQSVNAFRRCTVGSCASAATAGVSALNGLTGSLAVASGDGTSVSASGSTITINGFTAAGGRLTLAAGAPVMTASQSAKSTIFYDCYSGRYVPIYNGTSAVAVLISGCEYAMGLDAGVPRVSSGSAYDIFGVNNSGTVATCIGPAWSAPGPSAPTRGTGAGTTQIHYNSSVGFYTNQNALTNCYGGAAGTTNFGSIAADQATYLGSFLATANGQTSYTFGASASGGTAAVLNLYNAYNRNLSGTTVTDSGANYAYGSGTTTIRQARASAGNQIGFFLGLNEDAISVSVTCGIVPAVSATGRAQCGIGLDSTSSFTKSPFYLRNNSATNGIQGESSTGGQLFPALGAHVLSSNENSPDSTDATFNLNTNNTLDAIIRN